MTRIRLLVIILLAATLVLAQADEAQATDAQGFVTGVPYQDRGITSHDGYGVCIASGNQAVAYGDGYMSTGLTVWAHRCGTIATVTPGYFLVNWVVQAQIGGVWQSLPACGSSNGQLGVSNGYIHLDKPHCSWAIVGSGVPIWMGLTIQVGWDDPPGTPGYFGTVNSPVGHL